LINPASSPLVCPSCASVHSRLRSLRVFFSSSVVDGRKTRGAVNAVDHLPKPSIKFIKASKPQPIAIAEGVECAGSSEPAKNSSVNVSSKADAYVEPSSSDSEISSSDFQVNQSEQPDSATSAKRQRGLTATTASPPSTTTPVKRQCRVRVTAVSSPSAPAVQYPHSNTVSAKPSRLPSQATLQRQEMASIMRSITRDGFEMKQVEPDGSCLFRALSLQVMPSLLSFFSLFFNKFYN
jgi:hypothetical protein